MEEKILRHEPYVSYFYKLFTEEECDYVIKNCNDFNSSTNYSHEKKESQITDYRTSSTCWDPTGKFDFIRNRVLNLFQKKYWYISNFGLDHIEKIQIQKYDVGQEYKPHNDFFNFPGRVVTPNDRIATAILYLNDGFTGGETYFENLKLNVIPERGSLLFFEYKYIHELNKMTLHQGRPILSGTKYIASVWIRLKPFNPKTDGVK